MDDLGATIPYVLKFAIYVENKLNQSNSFGFSALYIAKLVPRSFIRIFADGELLTVSYKIDRHKIKQS